jgi:hypothetical protein
MPASPSCDRDNALLVALSLKLEETYIGNLFSDGMRRRACLEYGWNWAY